MSECANCYHVEVCKYAKKRAHFEKKVAAQSLQETFKVECTLFVEGDKHDVLEKESEN